MTAGRQLFFLYQLVFPESTKSPQKVHKKTNGGRKKNKGGLQRAQKKSMKSPQKVHQRTKKEQRWSSESPQKTHTETTKRPPVLWFYFFSQGKGG
jgi:hypothetical protein